MFVVGNDRYTSTIMLQHNTHTHTHIGNSRAEPPLRYCLLTLFVGIVWRVWRGAAWRGAARLAWRGGELFPRGLEV